MEIKSINHKDITHIEFHTVWGGDMTTSEPVCEYCRADWFSKYLWDDESNLEINDGRIAVEFFSREDDRYHYCTFEVNFCPMCGRKLGDRSA